MPAVHAAPSIAPDAARPGSPWMSQSWVPQNAFEPSFTPFIPSQAPQTGGPITGKFWVSCFELRAERGRGRWYMQLTAIAALSEAFGQLPMPMIKRGR